MVSDFFNQDSEPIRKLRRKLSGIGASLTVKLKNELTRRKMDASGSLRNSLKHEAFFRGGLSGVKIRVTMEGYGGFLNKNLYAKSPKLPNLGAILAWMDIKGVEPRQGMTKKQAAFAIAKSISKKGYIVYNGYKQGWADMVYAKAVQRMGEKATNDIVICMKEISDMEFNFLKLKK